MQNRPDRLSRGVDAEKAVPKSTETDGHRLQLRGGQLLVQRLQAFERDRKQRVGIDLHAPVRGGRNLIGDLLAEPGLLAALRVEQERAHTRRANVEACDDGIQVSLIAGSYSVLVTGTKHRVAK